jgi:hypothetical protein
LHAGESAKWGAFTPDVQHCPRAATQQPRAAKAANPLDALRFAGDPPVVIPTPSWLLLLWTGLAALLAAALIVAPLAGPRAPRGAIYFFRPEGFAQYLLLVFLGLVLYPLLYGLAFDLTHTASVLSGAAAGLAHAAGLLAIRAARRARIQMPLLTLLLYVVYGAVLGFLYVTP